MAHTELASEILSKASKKEDFKDRAEGPHPREQQAEEYCGVEGGVGLRTQYSSRPHPVVSALISVSRVQQGPVVPACLAWDARSSP